MLRAFCLCHPQSVDLLSKSAYDTPYAKIIRIACGTSKMPDVDLSEAGDFYPTYASWNSAFFETSVILTIWEHAAELVGSDHVAIIHSDIQLHYDAEATWKHVVDWIDEKPTRAVGLTVHKSYHGIWDELLIPKDARFVPEFDPMRIHVFENGIRVWDYIKQYDGDLYQWAMDTQPRLIYSHQFACSRQLFDLLGNSLYNIAQKLRFRDAGFWTPHMFERLIALYLVKHGGDPVLSTLFWHHSSSGVFGPGELSLYGPRPRKYLRLATRWNAK